MRASRGLLRRGRAGIAVSVVMVAAALPAIVPGLSTPAAAAEPTWMYSGDFQHVWDTGTGTYLNDHSIIRDPGTGKWHLFSITGATNPRRGAAPVSSENEDAILHATAPSLQGSWTRVADALTTDPTFGASSGGGESHLWAPHVIRACSQPSTTAKVPCASGGTQPTYYMFYAAGSLRSAGSGTDPSRAAINLATTTNLDGTWTRSGTGPLFRQGWEARDPFVAYFGNRWYMYYTATTSNTGGRNTVAYRTSTDLVGWSTPQVAFTDSTSTANQGRVEPLTESPTVVNRNGTYYLLIGPRGAGYFGTDVYASSTPGSFGMDRYAGHINAHAAEVVSDGSQQWVTSAGWFQKGLDLAPVEWTTGPRPWQSPSNVAVGTNADGRLEVFAIGADGATLDNRYQLANGGWSAWNEGQSGPFGPGGAASVPSVARNKDGRLEVFALDRADNTIAHRWQTAANSGWSAWEGKFGPTAAGASPVAALNSDGRMEVISIGPGGRSIDHRWQRQVGGDWSAWEKLGDAAGAPPVIARDNTGRLIVVASGPGSQNIALIRQTSPNSAFGPWNGSFGASPTGSAPILTTTANGTIVLLAVKPYGLGIVRNTFANGSWSGWDGSFGDGTAVSGPFTGAVSAVPFGDTVYVTATGPGTGSGNPNNYLRARQLDVNGNPITDWQIISGGENAECPPSGGVDFDNYLRLFKPQSRSLLESSWQGLWSTFGGGSGGIPCGQPGSA